MIHSYKRKPTIFQAVEWTGKNLQEVTSFIDGKPVKLDNIHALQAWEKYQDLVAKYGLVLNTMEGDAKASIGDYIVKGSKGEFYPCNPDVFHETYMFLPSDLLSNDPYHVYQLEA